MALIEVKSLMFVNKIILSTILFFRRYFFYLFYAEFEIHFL